MLLFLFSCESEDDSIINDDSLDLSSMIGIWARNDGQASTYLKLEGNTATTCNNNTITVGIFNTTSSPNATFDVGGVTYVFPLHMQGDNLIVNVPSQGNANHVPTEYIRSTSWPCGSGGGQGSGGAGGTPAPKTGHFGVKVYIPTGGCATSGSPTTTGGYYNGTLTMYYYHTGTGVYSSSTVALPGSGTSGQTDSQGLYYYSLYDYDGPIYQGGQQKRYKVEWNFYPNRTSYASSCVKTGVSTIDFDGQTKNVVVSW